MARSSYSHVFLQGESKSYNVSLMEEETVHQFDYMKVEVGTYE